MPKMASQDGACAKGTSKHRRLGWSVEVEMLKHGRFKAKVNLKGAGKECCWSTFLFVLSHLLLILGNVWIYYILVNSVQEFNICNMSLTINPARCDIFRKPTVVGFYHAGCNLTLHTRWLSGCTFKESAKPNATASRNSWLDEEIHQNLSEVSGDGLHLTRRSQSMQRFHAEIFTTFEPWERFWKIIWRCIWQHCWGLEERERCQIDSRIDDGLRKQAWEAWQVGFMGLRVFCKEVKYRNSDVIDTEML